MQDDLATILEGLSDDERKELMDSFTGMGTLDEKDALLQEQLQRADALAPKRARNYGTGAAAPIGAIADVLGAALGAHKIGGIDKQREALMQERKGLRQKFGALASKKPPTINPLEVGDVAPATEMDDGVPELLRRSSGGGKFPWEY
jgi:hypothetical protein